MSNNNRSSKRAKNYIESHMSPVTGDQFGDFKPTDRSNCVPAVRPVIRLRVCVKTCDEKGHFAFAPDCTGGILRNPEGRHPSERY